MGGSTPYCYHITLDQSRLVSDLSLGGWPPAWRSQFKNDVFWVARLGILNFSYFVAQLLDERKGLDPWDLDGVGTGPGPCYPIDMSLGAAYPVEIYKFKNA
jgi:hypothetical protein